MDSEIMIWLKVLDGYYISFFVYVYFVKCLGCYSFLEVNIVCKFNFVMCVKNEIIKLIFF